MTRQTKRAQIAESIAAEVKLLRREADRLEKLIPAVGTMDRDALGDAMCLRLLNSRRTPTYGDMRNAAYALKKR